MNLWIWCDQTNSDLFIQLYFYIQAHFPGTSSSSPSFLQQLWRMRIWFWSEDVAAALSLASLKDFQSGVCLRAAAIIFWSKFPHAAALTPSRIWPISSVSQALAGPSLCWLALLDLLFVLCSGCLTDESPDRPVMFCVSVITPYLWDSLLPAGSRSLPSCYWMLTVGSARKAPLPRGILG